MLKDIDFQPSYFKTRNELYNDFYKPCMENSIRYDRITGYFGSSVFLVISEVLKTFIMNKGKIRVICSPVLKEEDLAAIRMGYDNRLDDLVSIYLNEIIDELSRDYPNSTSLLSKMISSGVLDIRLAVFGDNSNAYRLMHDKAGVFTDESGSSVAFRGSINETFKGVSTFGNSESFDVFTTWGERNDELRAKLVIDQFNKMWDNEEPNIVTFEIPDLSLEKIREFGSQRNWDEMIDEVSTELFSIKNWFAETSSGSRKIKRHQEKVLNNWDKNGRKGLFEMCTGSGKTFTALCAIRESIFEKNEIPLIIVPSKLLFNQWKRELNVVFPSDITFLYLGAGNKCDFSKIRMYTNPGVKTKRIILTTYQTASKDNFIESVNWGNHIFLVCDEVHNIGSNKNITLLNTIVGPRIGLSATPKRYFDDDATRRIVDYFGGIIQPIYQISDAIKEGVLCEYFYDIYEVELTETEQENWNRLTSILNRKFAINKDSESIKDIKGVEKLLFERADILKKASNKIEVALQVLLHHYEQDQKWLVYLDDTEQVVSLRDELNKYDKLRGNVFEYHTNTDNDLYQTMEYFASSGAILLSINCLDEGVDIPAIDHAIILASSKNPRQYIQRRGRVLRRHMNKNFAYIYDCLVSPNSLINDSDKSISIVRGEIARAMSFSENSKNSTVVRNKLRVIMNNNNINIDEGGYGEDE